MNIEDLRLWKLNRPIANAIGVDGVLWLTFTEEKVNRMARTNPSGYLSQLSKWQDILVSQVMFSYNEESKEVIIVCIDIVDREPAFVGFVGHYNGEEVMVDYVTSDLPKRDYKLVKKELRKIYKKD